MVTKISRLFGVKLSKNGKNLIRKWVNEEFGSLYHAEKALQTEQELIDFVNDMLVATGMKLDDLSDKNLVVKGIKYCPYCGEYVGKVR